MKVSNINIETALQRVDEIHKSVDPTDEFEHDLYNQIIEVAELLVQAYNAAGVSRKDMDKDLRELLDVYFEAVEQFKMK